MIKKLLRPPGIVPFLMLLVLSITACSSSISLFDEQAYQQAVDLKVDALALMKQARQPYDAYEDQVKQLQKEMERAYEYAHGRPKNEVSARQWELMKNPDRHLMGGFLKRWRRESSLSPVFIEEARKNIGRAFDTIIQLESGKIKPSEMH